jgi:hypothetical protein
MVMRPVRLVAAAAAVSLLAAALAAPAAVGAVGGLARTQVAPIRAAAAVPNDVVVLSYDCWTAGTVATVVGEVRNLTDLPVRNVVVRASSLAADESLVASADGGPWFDILDPGDFASFSIDIANGGTGTRCSAEVVDWDTSGLVANHYFSGTYSQTPVNDEVMRVSATIVNGNAVPAGGIVAVVTLLDPEENVIGAAAVDVAGTLPSGGSTSFTVDVEHNAYGFTPSVVIDAESTSDPETSVTFVADPVTLTFGGATSVTGVAAPGSAVQVQRWDQPTVGWLDIDGDTIVAEADGSYALDLTPAVATVFRVVAGSAASVPVLMIVQDKVTLKASTKKATVNKKVVLSGTAQPADPGSKAQIQRKVGSTWKTIATVPITGAGAFKYTWTPKAKGTYVLRAYVEGQTLVFPGSSSSVTVVVK